MKTPYNQARAELRESFFKGNSRGMDFVNTLFLDEIYDKTPDFSKILDLGTGNGFVLEQLVKRSGKTFDLYGLDNSTEMLRLAQERTRGLLITFVLGDNLKIPFQDGYFDSVTAKNVTNLSAGEVYRVLKEDGTFFFREYGRWKGLEEVARLFERDLIRSRDPKFYLRTLSKAGFREIRLQEYHLPRTYSEAEIFTIIKMFPFIKKFDEDKEQEVKALFRDNDKITVTSDPIIITAVR